MEITSTLSKVRLVNRLIILGSTRETNKKQEEGTDRDQEKYLACVRVESGWSRARQNQPQDGNTGKS